MTAELESAVQVVHQANIDRYRQLLTTYLTDGERQFIKQRLTDEQEALRKATRRDLSIGQALS